MNPYVRSMLAVVRDSNDVDKRNHALYTKILAVVETLHGKKLTKRVANAVQKALPDHTLYYKRDQYGGHVMGTYIQVWGDGIDMNKRIQFALGCQDCVDVDYFVANNRCYGDAAAERIAERDAWLAEPGNAGRLAGAYEVLCSAQANFDKMVEQYGCEASSHDINRVLSDDWALE